MKNIIEICKEFGFEIPVEKQEDFSKAVSDNYLTRAEHEKKLGKAEADRDNWKTKADNAQTALEAFEGIDPKNIRDELDQWKRRAEDAEKDYQSKIAKRDFEDALKSEIESVKFTSDAAKRAVISEIREAGLTLRDGKIMGLSDLLSSIREKDASAFVDEEQQRLEANRARFTAPMKHDTPSKYKDKAEIFAIKDASERQAAIAQNLALFGKGEP